MPVTVEQRAHPRYPAHLPVRVHTDLLELDGEAEPLTDRKRHGADVRANIAGQLADVSERGLFVRSNFLEPPGTAVAVEVELGPNESVRLSGRVVWVAEHPPRGPGMGIVLDPSSSGRAVLERLERVS